MYQTRSPAAGRRFRLTVPPIGALLIIGGLLVRPARAEYVNFESSHVHPIALTPSGGRLLAINTPDARLEVFTVEPDGRLSPQGSIPVGLEPVTVRARDDREAWVVNHLSDSISIVDLVLGTVVRSLPVGDEPTDVVFAAGKAFVAVSREDAVKVFGLSDLSQPPQSLGLFGSDTRALAVSRDGSRVYAVVLDSGNQTTVINANVVAANNPGLVAARLTDLGLNSIACVGTRPPTGAAAYPPLPDGMARNQTLTDPSDGVPKVGLIVRYDPAAGKWVDPGGQDWTNCLPFRLPDHDLFVIDPGNATTPASLDRQVDHLGTTLFEVSVNPANGRIYVPHTEALNFVRFEHPLGVQGHMVDNRLAVVDPAAGYSVTLVDLNTHIDRKSDPATNLAERQASLSQPGMMVWNGAGTSAYLTAIGSRKLFRVDGACLSGPCIFGRDRATPDAVVVGEGPTGVALQEGLNRLYVLNRFSNSIAVVNAATLTKIGELPLHDPGPTKVRDGRRLLYDGIDTSGHGDAACSSCHVSGDKDGLAWDLGNPEGNFVPYNTPGDNVRCAAFGFEPPGPVGPPCTSHLGFDPQKGPMATQTLRGMLEPLHWRGDRGTMNAFNKAFVSLMGARDIGPINGEPAGLTGDQMELYRQFALAINLPPNPYRNLDDTLPNVPVTIPGNPFTGNPRNGEILFDTFASDGGRPCASCHQRPFGTTGGKLGGINPGDPQTAKAAIFNGNADGSPHSDLKVPHLRNLYEKFGPRFGTTGSPPDAKTGFGFIHDGSIPDLGTFLSAGVFSLNAAQVRDLTLFLVHFPTNIKPSVGRNLTLPPGVPPTGTPAQETLLSDLVRLGNLADPARHCELVAAATSGGRLRTFYLDGGIGAGGLWTTDVAGETQVSTADLRKGAAAPLTFLCAGLTEGVRLGADRDLDGHLNGDDCNSGDASAFAPPGEVLNLAVTGVDPASLTWDPQATQTGPGVRYDVASGSLSSLRSAGLPASTSCLAADLVPAAYNDTRADPPPGDGYYYLTRAEDSCGSGGFGGGGLDSLVCTAP